MMIRGKPWLSLRLRVILVTIGLQILFIVTFGGIQVYGEYRSMRNFVRDSSVTFAGCIAHSSAMVLSDADKALLAQHLSMAKQQHGGDVSYLLVQDRLGKVLASTFPGLEESRLTDSLSRKALSSSELIVQRADSAVVPGRLYQRCVFDVAVPILERGVRIGTLRLGVSSKGIKDRVWAVVLQGAWMAGLALLIGAGLAVGVDYKMQSSFRQLIRVTRSIAGGDLGQRVAINTGDELQELGETFNTMTEQLAASRHELEKWGEGLEEKVRLRTQELEEERQKLDGVVGGMGAALLLYDKDLRIQWVNSVARGWFGPLGAVAGCAESLSKTDGQSQSPAAARALATGEVEQCDTALRLSGGQRRFFHVTASPIRDQCGNVAQVVELVQDVTAQRQMEQQLLQASKMVAIGELAATVAHEINNPIAVIGASVERMQRLLERAGDRREQFPGYLDAIQRHVYRCKETVDKLLGFVRSREPVIEPTDLNRVVQDALGLVAPRAAFDGVRVVLDLDRSLPVLRTDARGLVQVVVNLLTNAIDACGGRGEIHVSSRRLNQEIAIEVSDNGSGIASEHLSAIFDPFFTTKPEGKGTGLGLPISLRIMNQLGGQLSVRSMPGAGTTFTVTLPAEKSAERVSV